MKRYEVERYVIYFSEKILDIYMYINFYLPDVFIISEIERKDMI